MTESWDERNQVRAGVALALALGAGCAAPAGTIKASVGDDSWLTLAPVGLQLRLGKLDAGGELAIARGDEILAHGRPEVGARLPVTIGARPCALTILRPYSYDDTSVRHDPRNNPRLGGPAVKTRTYRGLEVELSCADGPVPGTPAGQRGANPRRALAWALPAAILGALAGSFARSDRRGGERIGTATLIFLAAIGVALTVAWTRFDDDFRITLSAVGVGAVIAGVLAGRLWHRRKRHVSLAWSAGVVLGPLPVVLLSPAWSYGGPIGALACAAGGAVIAAVIAVMIKPLV